MKMYNSEEEAYEDWIYNYLVMEFNNPCYPDSFEDWLEYDDVVWPEGPNANLQD